MNPLDMIYEHNSNDELRQRCATVSGRAACDRLPGTLSPCIPGRSHISQETIRDNFLAHFANVQNAFGKCPICSKPIFTVAKLADCFEQHNGQILVKHLNTHPGINLSILRSVLAQ